LAPEQRISAGAANQRRSSAPIPSQHFYRYEEAESCSRSSKTLTQRAAAVRRYRLYSISIGPEQPVQPKQPEQQLVTPGWLLGALVYRTGKHDQHKAGLQNLNKGSKPINLC